VTFMYVFTIYLSCIYPLHHSPFPLAPLLRTLSKVSFFYFHAWIQNTSTIFTLIHPFLRPTPSH
jgi:hypothetical protein